MISPKIVPRPLGVLTQVVPMGVKCHRTKLEHEAQHWWPETGIASGKPRFQKLSKNAFFGADLVSRMSMEETMCIETNLDDAETPWGTVY